MTIKWLLSKTHHKKLSCLNLVDLKIYFQRAGVLPTVYSYSCVYAWMRGSERVRVVLRKHHCTPQWAVCRLIPPAAAGELLG